MKLRSKLLLSATCLLTISVAATATSAYAWFVSNRQASVVINNANVKTNATNLKIAGVAKANEDTIEFNTTATAGALADVTSEALATDISGDGVDFFKPKLAPDFGVGESETAKYNASSIAKVENDSTTKYYHQFKLTFSQDNADVNTGVFLSSESSVLLTTAIKVGEDNKNDAGIALCARVAFLDSSNNLLLYWAPNRSSTDANKSYIKQEYSKADPVSIKDGDTSEVLQNVSSSTVITEEKLLYGTPKDVNDASSTKDNNVEHLLTLNGTTAQTITVRIWFEGMDAACISSNITQTIDAFLQFNGVNMDI